MIKWYAIDDELPTLNTIRKIKCGGRHICLINYENEYFATSIRCPHAGADLSLGWCDKGKIICPYHRHTFDLTSGRGALGQGNYISIYPVEKRHGRWHIGLKQTWMQRWFGIK